MYYNAVIWFQKYRKSQIFKPYYYIIIDHLPNHYTLINYDKKSLFRFYELPYGIRELVKNKCMNSKGKTLYDYIPKFKKYNGNDEALDKVDDVNKKESDVLEGEDEDVETTQVLQKIVINCLIKILNLVFIRNRRMQNLVKGIEKQYLKRT